MEKGRRPLGMEVEVMNSCDFLTQAVGEDSKQSPWRIGACSLQIPVWVGWVQPPGSKGTLLVRWFHYPSTAQGGDSDRDREGLAVLGVARGRCVPQPKRQVSQKDGQHDMESKLFPQ